MSRLHVILVHSNPKRLRVRTRLFKETVRRLRKDGATVWRVEAAYRDRPFEVTRWWHCRDIQVRTSEEVWNKECLINIGAKHIFKRHPEATAVAWVDADVHFVRPTWVRETLFALDHHPVVQLFSNAIDLNPRHDFMGRAQGFAKLWREGQRPGDFETNKGRYPSHMHPGYGWAWRRDVWEAVGGMLTCGVLGSGDQHMACGLVGHAAQSVWPGVHPDYGKAVTDWGVRATEVTQGNIGYVEGLLLHGFHGHKEHRGYKSRVDILKQHQFSPANDLQFDRHGMPRLVGKPALRRDVATYMGSRKEYDLTEALEHPVKGRAV